MTIDSGEIEKDFCASPLGPRSRWFFESIALPQLGRSKAHARKLTGLDVVNDTPAWTLTFDFRGHRFLVDTNYHAALSQFFVQDPECPDDILLEVLQHFHELQPLRETGEHGMPRLWKIIGLLVICWFVLIYLADILKMPG